MYHPELDTCPGNMQSYGLNFLVASLITAGDKLICLTPWTHCLDDVASIFVVNSSVLGLLSKKAPLNNIMENADNFCSNSFLQFVVGY